MHITSLLSEGSTINLLAALVALTLLYAILLWLPFKGTTALMRVVRQMATRKEVRGRKPKRVRSTIVIR